MNDWRIGRKRQGIAQKKKKWARQVKYFPSSHGPPGVSDLWPPIRSVRSVCGGLWKYWPEVTPSLRTPRRSLTRSSILIFLSSSEQEDGGINHLSSLLYLAGCACSLVKAVSFICSISLSEGRLLHPPPTQLPPCCQQYYFTDSSSIVALCVCVPLSPIISRFSSQSLERPRKILIFTNS